MTEQTLLQQICEANKSFLAGKPRSLDPAGEPFAVVVCIDARLTGLLEPALGLPRDRAVVIRNAGNQLSEKNRDSLRSVAVALYVKHAREIIVLGHTDCGLANFAAVDVAEAFRKAGIPRTAFGDEDLRTWFGAFAGIKDNVLAAVGYLRNSGIVPQAVKIHGLIIDTARGAVEVVVDGNQMPALPVKPPAPEPEKAAASAEPGEKSEPVESPPQTVTPAKPQSEQKPKRGPIIVAKPATATVAQQELAAPGSMLEAAMILRDFIQQERQKPQMHTAILNLKAMWQRERNPATVFAEFQKIVAAYEAQYPYVPGALAYLENAVRSGGTDKIGFAEAMRRILT